MSKTPINVLIRDLCKHCDGATLDKYTYNDFEIIAYLATELIEGMHRNKLTNPSDFDLVVHVCEYLIKHE